MEARPRLGWTKASPHPGSVHRSVQLSSGSPFWPSSQASPPPTTPSPQLSETQAALQPSPP